MILFLESNGHRHHWRVNRMSDLSEVFAMFPQAEEIAMQSETMPEVVQNIANYLSEHHMEAWVEGNDDISKSVRGIGLALGLAAGTLFPSKGVPAYQHQEQPISATAGHVAGDNFGTHPHDRFLWNIHMIESSGGKNWKHPTVTFGLSQGDKAIGRWGLLPNTIKEMNTRIRLKGALPPEREKLETMSRDRVEQEFKKSPQLELDIARQLAGHVLSRQKGNMHHAAWAWTMGHNLHPDQIPQDGLKTSDYVGKFKSYDRRNPFKTHRVTTSAMAKSESASDFKGRLDLWMKARDEQTRHQLPHDTSWVSDPGRQREKELDEKPVTDPTQVVAYMQAKIKTATKP